MSRRISVSIRFVVEDFELVQRAAGARGVSVAKLIRESVLSAIGADPSSSYDIGRPRTSDGPEPAPFGSQEHVRRMREGHARAFARKYGVDEEAFLALTDEQRAYVRSEAQRAREEFRRNDPDERARRRQYFRDYRAARRHEGRQEASK